MGAGLATLSNDGMSVQSETLDFPGPRFDRSLDDANELEHRKWAAFGNL
jgi:hypothetical protein